MAEVTAVSELSKKLPDEVKSSERTEEEKSTSSAKETDIWSGSEAVSDTSFATVPIGKSTGTEKSSTADALQAGLSGTSDSSSDYGDVLQISTSSIESEDKSSDKASRRRRAHRTDAEIDSMVFGRHHSYKTESFRRNEFNLMMSDVILESVEDKDKQIVADALKEYNRVKHTNPKAAAKLFEKIRSAISIPKFKENMKKACKEHGLSDETCEKELLKASKLQTWVRNLALECSESEDEDEEILSVAVDDIYSAEKDYADAIVEIMPEETEAELAEKCIRKVEEYANAQNSDILLTVATGNYSEKIQSKIADKCAKVVSNSAKFIAKYLKDFWDSPKGKAIKSYTERLIDQYKRAKEDAQAKMKIVEAKKEEAEELRKESDKAIADANEKKKKAESMLGVYSGDLTNDEIATALKQKSVQQHLQYVWANNDKKRAEEAADEADFKVRLANIEANHAQLNAYFAKLKIDALIAKANAFMSAFMG